MFCRFWPIVGLLVLFAAPGLYAQSWPPIQGTNPVSRFASMQESDVVRPLPDVESTTTTQMPSEEANFDDSVANYGDWVSYDRNQGLFFQYDYLYWAITAPGEVVIGDEGSEGFITTPEGVTFYHENSLNTSWLKNKFVSGHRFDFGLQGDQTGLLVSVLGSKRSQSIVASGVDFVPHDPYGMLAGYADGNGDGFDDDLNLNNIFGRHGQDMGTSDGGTPPTFNPPFDGTPDTPAAVDTGDQVFWLVTYATMRVSHETRMTGFEVMGLQRSYYAYPENQLEWIYGIRYLQIKDTFGLHGTGGFLDVTSLDTHTDNEIIGPQIGVRWRRQTGFVSWNAECRFAAAANFQRTDMAGHIATNQSPGGQNQPVSLNAIGFTGSIEDTSFAPITEFRLETICHINPWIGFRIGYAGMLVGGVSRATEKVAYELPSFQLSNAASREVVFASGMSFGIEVNR